MYTDTSFQNIKQNISITYKIFIYLDQDVSSLVIHFMEEKSQLFKKLFSF